MSQNDVKLNEIKDFAFLADKSYKTANGKKGSIAKSKRWNNHKRHYKF